ncbi:MAG: sugar kinase [Acetobacteraceae bacterium]|nr:sugar kinase [Acetobacteraceae bacterium]
MDLVTIGESMLRFMPPVGSTLEAADRFLVVLAGAESNVAIGVQRLGMAAGWVSKLPQNALGRKALNAVRAHGVDVSRVVLAPRGRMGLYFTELPGPPRPVGVVYDRHDSCFSTLEPAEVDWDYVRRASILHLTGITPALGAGCRRVVHRALEVAKGAGLLTTFDVNFRSRLWTAGEAGEVLGRLLPGVDVLIAAAEDVQAVFGLDGAPAEVAAALQSEFKNRVVVLTLGDKGALGREGTEVVHEPAVPGVAVDPIGRGDAFVAGFIFGYIAAGLKRGLAYGSAMASLKQTYVGDVAWCTAEDVGRVAGGDVNALRR